MKDFHSGTEGLICQKNCEGWMVGVWEGLNLGSIPNFFSMFWDTSQNNWCPSQTYPKRRCNTILPVLTCQSVLQNEEMKIVSNRVWHTWAFRSQQIYPNIFVLKNSHELVFKYVWCEKRYKQIPKYICIQTSYLNKYSNNLDTNIIFVNNSILLIIWSLRVLRYLNDYS